MLGGTMALRASFVLLMVVSAGVLRSSEVQTAPAAPCDKACMEAAWNASEAARGRKDYAAAAADLLPVAAAGERI